MNHGRPRTPWEEIPRWVPVISTATFARNRRACRHADGAEAARVIFRSVLWRALELWASRHHDHDQEIAAGAAGQKGNSSCRG